MHSHFCPQCGQALAFQKCKKETRWGFTHVLCPKCLIHAEHSGGILLILGLIIAMTGGMIIALDALALAIASGFSIIGVIRLIRQFRAAKNYTSSIEE